MDSVELEKLKYPIGQHHEQTYFSEEDIQHWIRDISSFPEQLEQITASLTEEQLEYLHRPDGWTVRQLVHHCADSHMNALMRSKLALTEHKPVVTTYDEVKWAKLNDSMAADISSSLEILHGIHQRWTMLLDNLNEAQLKRTFYHPGQRREVSLGGVIDHYSWHGKHHLAHIRQALEYKGDFEREYIL
ncbi:putative metal-dependent hydrolase YfiT [Echinicola pacifica]|uniref:Metal-dependent hydrolase YfiT n=1 Tax=Echinicola pacifica TaxID=346377 RepID=A0A918ULL2_9BACT|nr:putative metal-dependent hydrolase [Echinicola pacifica]GGZ20599.1 putative metal-dependent hydrolase YfiT [Echinicola pacifica]